MSAQIKPEGVKFSGNDAVQTKPVITVGGVGPNTTGENIGDVPLNLTDINQRIQNIKDTIDLLKVVTYSISPEFYTINEGTPLTISVETSYVASGTTLYWSVSRPEDFDVDSGSFQVTGTTVSSIGSFTVTPTADLTTESATETFTVSISLTSGGSSVATTDPITINDTSQTPAVQSTQYTVISDKTVVAEGEPFKISVLPGPDFPGMTDISVQLGSSGTTVDDIFLFYQNETSFPQTRTIFGYGGNGFFPSPDGVEYLFKANLDNNKNDGIESFKFTANVDVNIEVNVDVDHSLPPWGYALSASPNSANEGQKVIITLNTVNVPDGTILSYTLSGQNNFNSNDISNFNPSRVDSNTVLVDFPPISNNSTSAEVTISNDGVPESGEIMDIRAVYRSEVNKTASLFSEIVFLSNIISVPVSDSGASQSINVFAQGPISNPELRQDYAPEGYSIHFEIPCDDLATGTMVSWQLSGTGGFDLDDIEAYYKSSSTNNTVLGGNPGYTGSSEVVEVTTYLNTVVKLCKLIIYIKQDSITESGEYVTLTSRGKSATMEVRDY